MMKQCSAAPEFEAAPSNDGIIQKIAAAIGVPVEAFFSDQGQIVFYVEPDGRRWILEMSSTGAPIVRSCISGRKDQDGPRQSVTSFLASSISTPEGKAFTALVDRALFKFLSFARED